MSRSRRITARIARFSQSATGCSFGRPMEDSDGVVRLSRARRAAFESSRLSFKEVFAGPSGWWCFRVGRDRMRRLKHWFTLASTRPGNRIMGPGWGAMLAVSPSFRDDRTLFVAGPLGLLRSRDGGVSFQRVCDGEVRCAALSPNFGSDRTAFVTFDNGVFRSVGAGGDTWQLLADLAGMQWPRLAISPAFAADQTLFVGGDNGLCQSTDGGHRWQRLAAQCRHARCVDRRTCGLAWSSPPTGSCSCTCAELACFARATRDERSRRLDSRV